jgi:hypothetical protein
MPLTRRGRLTVTLTVTTAVLCSAAYVVNRTSVGAALGAPASRPPCTLSADTETYRWTREQAMTATTVTGVGLRIGATPNGVAVAVRRALRTSGEHTALSPRAARAIYRALSERAHPAAPELAVARALLGYHDGALACVVPNLHLGSGPPRQDPGRLGLTPRAERLRREMQLVYGRQVLGGFSPQGVTSGHIQGSAHYEGRAIDVFFRPVTVLDQRRGWAQAQWAVAHSDALDIATVIFDARIWTARHSVSGWRDYQYPGGATDNPILLHRDHVHVDVVEGS